MRVLSVIVFAISLIIGLSLAYPLEAQQKVALFVVSPFVRQALSSKLQSQGFITTSPDAAEHIQDVFSTQKPDFVLCDGSGLNSIDAMLIYEHQVLAFASQNRVKKLILLTDSTIYPKNTPLPLQEKALTTLNTKTVMDPYALAKLSSFTKCHEVNNEESPRCILAVYAELYGPYDLRCTPKNRHPLYQAVDRIARAKKENQAFTVIANDGTAQYDLLYIDDFAEAVVHLLKMPCTQEVYNIGIGRDQKMEAIIENLHAVSGYKGEVILDKNCYDRIPRRILDVNHLYALGWTPTTSLQEGLTKTITWYSNILTES